MYQSFYTGALGAGTCMAKMSVISNNIANVNNYGFKPKTAAFTDLIQFNLNDSETAVTELQSGDGVRMQRTYSSYNVDAFHTTNQPLDFAIAEDNAFFMVRDPATNQITYTRSGHFHRGELGETGDDEEGGSFYLLTDGGKLVLDQNGQPLKADTPDIQRIIEMMQEDYEPEEVDEEEDEEEDEDAPKLSVYTFSNPSRLLSVGDNEFEAPEDMQPSLIETGNIVPGVLEASGTDLGKELVRMIECQRAYSYALKMVVTADEVESTINGLRG